VLALAAPWYPLVVDGDAWAFEVPHQVVLHALDGDVLAAGRALGDGGRGEARAAYVLATVLPEAFETVRTVRGVRIVLGTFQALHPPPPPERRGPDGLIDLAYVDVGRLVGEVADEAIASAHAFGVPIPDEIVVWQVPSRTELAATAP